MKKHTHLIKLVIIIAALIGLGIMTFKYLYTQQTSSTKINTHTTIKKEISTTPVLLDDPIDNVEIQTIQKKINNTGREKSKNGSSGMTYTCGAEGQSCCFNNYTKKYYCYGNVGCNQGKCIP